jgi:oligo-1,6-glucosidase
MHWDDSSHAGFTEGIPWLPANPNYVAINAEAAVADPNSVFHHFKSLIKLRHDHPVMVDGRFELMLPDDEQIWALTRTLDDQVLIMIANCSSEAARCRLGCCLIWLARPYCSPPTRTGPPWTCSRGVEDLRTG